MKFYHIFHMLPLPVIYKSIIILQHQIRFLTQHNILRDHSFKEVGFWCSAFSLHVLLIFCLIIRFFSLQFSKVKAFNIHQYSNVNISNFPLLPHTCFSILKMPFPYIPGISFLWKVWKRSFFRQNLKPLYLRNLTEKRFFKEYIIAINPLRVGVGLRS